jgi:zinc protease
LFALGGAKVSRLDAALVYKLQTAQTVSCESVALKLTGITSCEITAKPGVKLEELEATFWSEVERLQKDGPTAEEVEASKALNLTHKISGSAASAALPTPSMPTTSTPVTPAFFPRMSP